MDSAEKCSLCPRDCRASRSDRAGYCRSGEGYEIASICLHRGEEPGIGGERGICNVFFSHCNLQCLYCQNHQISRNDSLVREFTFESILESIEEIFAEGVSFLGFVSPSHMIPAMKRIICGLRKRGRNPRIVFNTNAYDRVETLRGLEGEVDVYLPDFKYVDAGLARAYSEAADYPEVALLALKEMYRQKGSMLQEDDSGLAQSGLIVRHLVLPGAVENSIQVLRTLAEELSPNIHLSLMAQYRPMPLTASCSPLDRRVSEEEYGAVIAEMERLGFHRGWVQSLDSPDHYHPDFNLDHPFENR